MKLTPSNKLSVLLAIPSLILFGPFGLLFVAIHRLFQEGFSRIYKAWAIREMRKSAPMLQAAR